MTTHISKMLAGPAKSMTTEGASTQRPPLGDGITAVRFEGEPEMATSLVAWLPDGKWLATECRPGEIVQGQVWS